MPGDRQAGGAQRERFRDPLALLLEGASSRCRHRRPGRANRSRRFHMSSIVEGPTGKAEFDKPDESESRRRPSAQSRSRHESAAVPSRRGPRSRRTDPQIWSFWATARSRRPAQSSDFSASNFEHGGERIYSRSDATGVEARKPSWADWRTRRCGVRFRMAAVAAVFDLPVGAGGGHP